MSGSAIVFILFIVCIFLNIPIGYALAISSVVTLLVTGMTNMTLVFQTYISSANSFPLLAIPFFILAGDLMLNGGISDRLVNMGRALFGHKKGAMGTITVFCCAIFAALSGSAPATVAAIGGIMIPAMQEEGYDDAFAATLAAASGTLGPIIPPSIIMAMYGVTCSVSISDLFVAGVIPGLLLAGVLILWAKSVSIKHGFGLQHEKIRGKERTKAIIRATWALICPIIILGGIYTGAFTPTESAVVACVYALLVSIYVFGELKWKDVPGILYKSSLTAGTSLILLGGANVFGRIFALDQLPGKITNFIMSISDNRIVVLLIVNVFLIIVGMFMETLAAVVILSPLLLNVVTSVGVSPLHFGLILTVNLCVGLCTPPVGINSFIAAGKANTTIGAMMKYLVPCCLVMMAALMMITYIPALSEFLPNLFRALKA